MKNFDVRENTFRLSRHQPAEDLTFFVEHYWIVSWNLRERDSYRVEILPHPRVHLVVAQGQANIFGVVKGPFPYLYEQTGRVFGVRFKPGAFYPFVCTPIARLTNTSKRLIDVFGGAGATLEEALLTEVDEATMVAIVERFLRERLPARDKCVEMLYHIFDDILISSEITRVDDVVRQLNLSKRTVQRLFYRYVGVSPKWVIKHYRLHEVAQRLAKDTTMDWSELALDLGYCDQAHFIKDFKAMLGKSPAEYAKTIGTDSYHSATCVLLHKTNEKTEQVENLQFGESPLA